MKAVMLSVRPQWCELIAGGQKTIEVRKTVPKISPPFKCFIYQTRSGKVPTGLFTCDGEIMGRSVKNGKVIGEFVCDKMYGIYYSIYPHDPLVFEEIGTLNRPDVISETHLSEIELDNYLNGNNGYGWNISAMQIYDKPRELSEFRKPIMPTGLRYEDDAIKRAPQSWCYVEELT